MVERETIVFDLPFRLKFLDIIPDLELIVFRQCGFADRVQQVEIKITGLRAAQTFLKLRFCLFGSAGDTAVEFCCQVIAFTRITFDQCFADRVFRSRINECSIKILHSGSQETVDHHLGLFDIDGVLIDTGETHQTETEFWHCFNDFFLHFHKPSLFSF